MSYSQEQIASLVEGVEANANPFIAESLRNTAKAIVEDAANIREGQKVLIWFDPPALPLIKELHNKCLGRGAEVRFFMRDYEGDAVMISELEEDGIREMFDEEDSLIKWSDNMLIIRNPEDPEAMGRIPKEKSDIYFDQYEIVHETRSRDDGVAWTLFLWPTEYEAHKEGVDYDVYFRQYMEACNQPWREIHSAQAILKEKLDAGEILEFYANEDDPDPNKRTHLTMSIEGMTFANDTVQYNYPGSEVFSAPVLNTVNGQIYAEGEYLYDGYLMKNIYLRVENGRIVEAYAELGNEGLQALLNRDDEEEGFGSRYFGECALGTNGGLLRRFFNPLLNEKVSGSFHMAIGQCYRYTVFHEDSVNVNNGNTSDKTSLHWDLTILMHRNPDGTGGGRVILDGVEIQVDGYFLDERLEILNPRLK